jgi:hypothetical protein
MINLMEIHNSKPNVRITVGIGDGIPVHKSFDNLVQKHLLLTAAPGGCPSEPFTLEAIFGYGNDWVKATASCHILKLRQPRKSRYAQTMDDEYPHSADRSKNNHSIRIRECIYFLLAITSMLTERPRIQEQEFLESQTFINGLGPGVFLK